MPIKNYLFFTIFLASISTLFLSMRARQINGSHKHTPVFVLMLDPAGDARYTGRKIDETFERGITLQCTQELKKSIEQQFANVSVLLTRSPGELVAPLQNANFANRAQVHLFISIHFYQENKTKPCMYLYTFNNSNDLITKAIDFSFYNYDKAHLFNYATTQNWADTLRETLSAQTYSRFFEIKGTYNIPFKPLVGIQAPAIALEIGIKNKNDWQHYIEPLVDSIGILLKNKNLTI